jgi:hypothetical protein
MVVSLLAVLFCCSALSSLTFVHSKPADVEAQLQLLTADDQHRENNVIALRFEEVGACLKRAANDLLLPALAGNDDGNSTTPGGLFDKGQQSSIVRNALAAADCPSFANYEDTSREGRFVGAVDGQTRRRTFGLLPTTCPECNPTAFVSSLVSSQQLTLGNTR